MSVLAAAACIGLVALGVRHQTMQSELLELSSEVRDAARRERELEATVARQHQASLLREAELETLRFQLAAVELQLDGVDYLSQQVRTELDLPPSSGSWSGTAGGAAPQGGSGASAGPDADRLTLAQRRLAAGLADLYQLLEVAQERMDTRGPAAVGDVSEPRLAGPPENWPARGAVSSAFGWRVFRGVPNFHTGIDISLPYGSEVLATGNGLVLGSGWQPGYGWSVLLQHGQGYSSLYAHLSSVLVTVGDRVAIGDAIGMSGSSGNSTGPHLHYEIWKDGQLLDPRPFMDGRGPTVTTGG